MSGCASSPKIYTDYDTSQSFSSYKKIAWKQDQILVSGTYPVSEYTKTKMKKAFEDELTAKGFEFVENNNDADLLLALTLGARDKIKTRRVTEYRIDPYSWRWGSAYYPYYFPDTIPVTQEVPYQFTEGSISVDFFDRADMRPVWHSNATKKLKVQDLRGVSNNQAQVANSLLEGFPPL